MNNKNLTASTFNLYHRWAYLDELFQALNQDIHVLSGNLDLPVDIIKIIRTLGFLDGISFAILNSFCHPKHPEQVDIYKKLDWIKSLRNILHQWHEIFHVFMQISIKECNVEKFIQKLSHIELNKNKKNVFTLDNQFNEVHLINEKKAFQKMLCQWNKKHASLIFSSNQSMHYWQILQTNLVDFSLILSVTNDQPIDAIKQKYAHIEPFFRGIHQMLEVAMNVMLDYSEALQQNIQQLHLSSNQMKLDPAEYQKVVLLRAQMQRMQQWWEIAAQHIMLLSKMDTGSYAEYRQALLGSSGGDSKQLRQLKQTMTQLHFSLPRELHDQSILIHSLVKHSSDPLLNQLLSAIRELQAASSDFWLRHFTLTANTIGMIRGSQGLPVEKLISFAVNSLLKQDSLLCTVGNVGQEYARHPEATIIKIDHNKEKVVGDTIFAHVKNQCKIVGKYNITIHANEPLLDSLELRPLEPNDTANSPYASWFHPDIHLHGLRFTMHSFGVPLILLNDSVTNTTQRIVELQDHSWEVFFNVRMAQLQKILFNLLAIPENGFFAVSVDANVTALLERLLSALPRDTNATVLTTQQEFLTVNRALVSSLIEHKLDIVKISLDTAPLNIAEVFCDAIQKIGKKLKLVVFSQVTANSQMSMTLNEINTILDSIPTDVPVIIDATQGVFNVPISWGEILKNRTNIYLLGSAIKHGRSTSGLGFLIHPQHASLLTHPKKTGWCAYLSGLSMGRTTDDVGNLLYDEAWQWLGGTPANIFALEIFINTWDAILRAGETVQSMHRYVQSLHGYFLQLMATQPDNQMVIFDKARREQYPGFASNVLALRLKDKSTQYRVRYAAEQKVHFDQREERFVRLGFGIQHGRKDVEKLYACFESLSPYCLTGCKRRKISLK